MAVFALLVVFWLFIPSGSKFAVLLHLIVPTLGPWVCALTALYYYAGRQRRSGDMTP
jgi:cytosine/uracil/thiamine/allantoin permease